MAKLNGEEGGSLPKSERQKLRRLFTQGGAIYGTVHNLVKTSNLPVSKVRLFAFRTFLENFTLATREFKRLKEVARFKNEVLCKELAYVHKIANYNSSVKYPEIVRVCLREPYLQKRTKDSKEMFRAILTIIKRKKRSKKIGSTRKEILLQRLKNYAKLKEYKFTLQGVRLTLHWGNAHYDP